MEPTTELLNEEIIATEILETSIIYSGSTSKDSIPETSQKLVHFELNGDKQYTLKALGGTYALQMHDEQSLAANPNLKTEASGRVSHFVTIKAPPARGIQLIRIYGPADNNGIPSLESMAISMPDDNGIYTKEDLAAALLFLHPGLSVLTSDHAPQVLDAIHGSSGFAQMSEVMRSLGDKWNKAVALQDEKGNNLYDSKRNVLYEYRLTSAIENLRASVSRQAKVDVSNDPSLSNVRWRVLNGVPSIDISEGRKLEASAPAGYKFKLQDPGPNYGFSAEILELTEDFELKLRLHNSYIRHGGVYVGFLGGDGKTPIVVPEDSWLSLIEATARDWVAEWIAELKHSLNPDDPPVIDKAHILNFLGLLGAETTFLGVPVSSASADYAFKLPSGDLVSAGVRSEDHTIGKIRVLCGSLGYHTENDWDPTAAWIGIALTLFLDIALPTIALCATAGTVTDKLFDSIFKDVKFLVPTLAQIALTIKDAVQNPDLAGGDVVALLTGLADTIVQKVLSAADVGAKLAAYFGAEEAAEAIPIVGWALKAEAIEADIEQLAQTVGEVIGSPRVVEFDITVTMDTKFTILPTGKEGFPARTHHFTITAQYSDVTGYTYTAELPDPKVDRIELKWENLPIGGTVTFLIAFYSSEGWLIGKGQSDTLANRITSGQGALIVPQVTITELLYPLTGDTTYAHQQLLRYQDGKHQWLETTTPPSETVKDLSTGDSGHGLDSLGSVTLNSDLGVVGYSWEASGQDVPLIGTSSPRAEVCYTFQNISFDSNPESGLMFTPAGYNSSPLLVYLRAAAAGAHNPGAFFLDPVADQAGGFHLRGITPVTDPSVPSNSPRRLFDQSTSLSWGRFRSPMLPTSLALHSNGCVVAVASGYSKLQILELPDAAAPSDRAPWAQVLSGPGSREGLLSAPQLVAIGPDQTIFVLEAGNARIQAFSRGGHPVPAFSKLATPYWIPLFSEKNDPENVTYTAISAEIQGHLYVLSYEDAGYDPRQFRLDIYTPDGSHLLRQRGLNAALLSVDLWRNLYTVNYQKILGPGGRTEPSVSEWVPYTPKVLQAPRANLEGIRVKGPDQPIKIDTWILANSAYQRLCYMRTYYQEWNSSVQEPYDNDGFGAVIFYPNDQGGSPNQWNVVWVNQNTFALQAADSGKYAWAGSLGWGGKFGSQLGFSHRDEHGTTRGNDSFLSGNYVNGLFQLQHLGGNDVAIQFVGNPYGRPTISFNYDVYWNDDWYVVAATGGETPGPRERIALTQADPMVILLLSGSATGLNLSGRDLSFGGRILSLAGVDFSGANLEGADFSHLADPDLKLCNFSNARLKNAVMGMCKNVNYAVWHGADLTGVDFSHATFDPNHQTDFGNTTLNNATLDGLLLKNANLVNAKLVGAKLRKTQLQGANLASADLTGARLEAADLSGANLTGTIFNNCDLTQTSLGANPQFGRSANSRTLFRNATIPANQLGRDWSYLDMTGASLTAIPKDLSGLKAQYTLLPALVDLHGVKLTQAHFENAQMYYADLHGSDLAGAFFDGALLKGARLNGANLSLASLKGTWLIAETDVKDPNKYEAAQVSKAFLLNTCLDGSRCDGVDFSGAIFLTDAALSLQPASAKGAFMNLAKFNDAKVIGVSFRGTQLAGANFSGATLITSQFAAAQLTPASTSNAVGASVYKADIRGTQFADVGQNGRITNPANMDGLDMNEAIVSTNTGSFKQAYEDYYGQPVPVIVQYGPTVLGTTTASTVCPNGGNGPCSL